MAFTQLPSYTKTVSMLPDNPTLTTSDLKAQFDAAPNELLTYFNNLITALKQTISGDSGAKNLGATTVTGLSGNDVQTILESINTNKMSGDGPGLRLVRATGQFFTNGTSNTAQVDITFGTPFAAAPMVFAGNATPGGIPYSDNLTFPYIFNVTSSGFSCKITTASGSSLGTAGTPANLFMDFIAIGA